MQESVYDYYIGLSEIRLSCLRVVRDFTEVCEGSGGAAGGEVEIGQSGSEFFVAFSQIRENSFRLGDARSACQELRQAQTGFRRIFGGNRAAIVALGSGRVAFKFFHARERQPRDRKSTRLNSSHIPLSRM